MSPLSSAEAKYTLGCNPGFTFPTSARSEDMAGCVFGGTLCTLQQSPGE